MPNVQYNIYHHSKTISFGCVFLSAFFTSSHHSILFFQDTVGNGNERKTNGRLNPFFILSSFFFFFFNTMSLCLRTWMGLPSSPFLSASVKTFQFRKDNEKNVKHREREKRMIFENSFLLGCTSELPPHIPVRVCPLNIA